jgi:hypothetical protein
MEEFSYCGRKMQELSWGINQMEGWNNVLLWRIIWVLYFNDMRLTIGKI